MLQIDGMESANDFELRIRSDSLFNALLTLDVLEYKLLGCYSKRGALFEETCRS